MGLSRCHWQGIGTICNDIVGYRLGLARDHKEHRQPSNRTSDDYHYCRAPACVVDTAARVTRCWRSLAATLCRHRLVTSTLLLWHLLETDRRTPRIATTDTSSESSTTALQCMQYSASVKKRVHLLACCCSQNNDDDDDDIHTIYVS